MEKHEQNIFIGGPIQNATQNIANVTVTGGEPVKAAIGHANDAPKSLSEFFLAMLWGATWKRVLVVLFGLALAVFALWDSLPDATKDAGIRKVAPSFLKEPGMPEAQTTEVPSRCYVQLSNFYWGGISGGWFNNDDIRKIPVDVTVSIGLKGEEQTFSSQTFALWPAVDAKEGFNLAPFTLTSSSQQSDLVLRTSVTVPKTTPGADHNHSPTELVLGALACDKSGVLTLSGNQLSSIERTSRRLDPRLNGSENGKPSIFTFKIGVDVELRQ